MKKISTTLRLTIIVYLFLLSLSIIFGLLGVQYNEISQPLGGLLLNLSTELAGAVLIFIVVKFFLVEKDADLSDRFKALKNGIATKFSPLSWGKELYSRFKWQEYLFNSESIYIQGYFHAYMLGDFKTQIAEAVAKGAIIKLLLVNKESDAGKLMESNANHPEWIQNNWDLSQYNLTLINRLLDDYNNPTGSLEVKCTEWISSTTLILFNRKNSPGFAIAEINPPSINLPINKIHDRLCITMNQDEHYKEFDYFKTHFETLWNDEKTKTMSVSS